MKFLKLTDYSTNRPVALNISHIESVNELEDGSAEIMLSSGNYIITKESYLDVTGQIYGLIAH